MDDSAEHHVVVSKPGDPLPTEVRAKLREGLGACPDVAFAHLTEVEVRGRPEPPCQVLFVWLTPGALRSLRSALNLVSEVVARSIPEDRFLDVVILNSAAELVERVEAAGCLLVERDPEERRRALAAAASGEGIDLQSERRRWWWPF